MLSIAVGPEAELRLLYGFGCGVVYATGAGSVEDAFVAGEKSLHKRAQVVREEVQIFAHQVRGLYAFCSGATVAELVVTGYDPFQVTTATKSLGS